MRSSRGKDRSLDLLHIHPLTVIVSGSLADLLQPGQGKSFLSRVASIRDHIAEELGFLAPEIRFSSSPKLPPNEYDIRVHSVRAAGGRVYPDRYLVIGPEALLSRVPGERTTDPTYGIPAVWVDRSRLGEAHDIGCIAFDAGSVIATHITEVIRRHADEFLGREAVSSLLENLKESHPALVKDLTATMTLRNLQKILQNLLKERVSIRNLPLILETLTDHIKSGQSPTVLTEYVRRALAPAICAGLQNNQKVIKGISIDASVERLVLSNIRKVQGGHALSLDQPLREQMLQATEKELRKLQGLPQVLLCSPKVRLYLRHLLERDYPDLFVLSYLEVAPGAKFEIQGTIRIRIPLDLRSPLKKGWTAAKQGAWHILRLVAHRLEPLAPSNQGVRSEKTQKNMKKAAILLRTLPLRVSSRVFSDLGPEEVRALTREMSRMPEKLGQHQKDEVIKEFLKLWIGPNSVRSLPLSTPDQAEVLQEIASEDPGKVAALLQDNWLAGVTECGARHKALSGRPQGPHGEPTTTRPAAEPRELASPPSFPPSAAVTHPAGPEERAAIFLSNLSSWTLERLLQGLGKKEKEAIALGTLRLERIPERTRKEVWDQILKSAHIQFDEPESLMKLVRIILSGDESSLPSSFTATAAQKLAALLLSLPDSVGAEIAGLVLSKLEGRQLTDVVFEMNQMGKSVFLPARMRTLREFFDYYHGSSQSFLYPGQTQAEIERLTLKNPERVARCIKLFWIEQGAIVREVFKTLAEHHPTRLGKAILEFWEAVRRNRTAFPSSRKAATFLGGCHPEVKEEIEKHLGGHTIKALDSFSPESAPPLHQVQMEFLKHYYLLYQEEIRHSTL